MKKVIPIVVILLLLIGGGIVIKKVLSKPAAVEQAPQKKRITVTPNLIPVTDRPYVQIIPKDIHNLTIVINDLKKPETTVDYEIEYQTDGNLEGAQGSFDVSTLPAKSKDILLGSCSAGGACRYHAKVQGGKLTTDYSGTGEPYALESEWHYIENPKNGTDFSSTDAKFQITSKDMATQKIVVIFNSPGYPKGLSGTPISDAYTLSPMDPVTGKGTLTMRATEDASTASIMGWDGSKWTEFKGKADGKSITADVSLMQLYVVVKK